MGVDKTLILQITIATVMLLVVYVIFSSKPPITPFTSYHPRGTRKSYRRSQPDKKPIFARTDIEFSEEAQANARKMHKPVTVADGQVVQPLELKLDTRVKKIKQNTVNTHKEDF